MLGQNLPRKELGFQIRTWGRCVLSGKDWHDVVEFFESWCWFCVDSGLGEETRMDAVWTSLGGVAPSNAGVEL